MTGSPQTPAGGMPIVGLGISTNADMIDGDDELLAEHLGQIADAGCTHAELILQGLDVVVGGALQPARVRRVASVLASAGLRYSIHLPYDLNLMDQEWGDDYRAVFDAGLEFAGDIGAELVVYHSSFLAPGSGAVAAEHPRGRDLLKRDIDQLRALGDAAERNGVVIGVENNAWTDPAALTYGLRPSDIARHVEAVAHPNVGITLDLGHLHLTSAAYGWGFIEEIAAVRPLLAHVHAHDNFARLSQNGQYNKDLPLGRGDLHLPMGWGSIDWETTIDALAGYSGIWMMEIEYRLSGLFPEIVTEATRRLGISPQPQRTRATAAALMRAEP